MLEAVLAWQLVQQSTLVGAILIATGVVVLLGLLVYLIRLDDKVAKDRMAVALVLIVVSMVFWSFFEQAGSSMNLFTERNVDRRVFGWTVPTEYFQSVNPLFILSFGLFFSWLWVKLARRSLEPSIPLKFGFGIVQLGLGFGALYIGAIVSASNGIVGVGWLILGYLLHTTGELCVSPIGLSMITKLSPPRVVGVMMGAWFLSSAFAQYVASVIAALTGVSGGAEGARCCLHRPKQSWFTVRSSAAFASWPWWSGSQSVSPRHCSPAGHTACAERGARPPILQCILSLPSAPSRPEWRA